MQKTLPYLLIFLAVFSTASASGYRPEFNRAAEEADIIILGDVTDEWDPIAGDEITLSGTGRMFKVTAVKVFKGEMKPLDTMFVWDVFWLSTAGYYIRQGQSCILFLVAYSPPAIDRKYQTFGIKKLKADPEKLFNPIRCFNQTPGLDTVQFEGCLTLLNTGFHHPGQIPKAIYTEMLSTQDNRFVLRYLVDHWPEPVTQADISLFRRIARKFPEDKYLNDQIIKGYGIKFLVIPTKYRKKYEIYRRTCQCKWWC